MVKLSKTQKKEKKTWSKHVFFFCFSRPIHMMMCYWLFDWCGEKTECFFSLSKFAFWEAKKKRKNFFFVSFLFTILDLDFFLSFRVVFWDFYLISINTNWHSFAKRHFQNVFFFLACLLTLFESNFKVTLFIYNWITVFIKYKYYVCVCVTHV